MCDLWDCVKDKERARQGQAQKQRQRDRFMEDGGSIVGRRNWGGSEGIKCRSGGRGGGGSSVFLSEGSTQATGGIIGEGGGDVPDLNIFWFWKCAYIHIHINLCWKLQVEPRVCVSVCCSVLQCIAVCCSRAKSLCLLFLSLSGCVCGLWWVCLFVCLSLSV